MQPDGSVYPTSNKSTVIHLLENMTLIDVNKTQEDTAHRVNDCQELQGLQKPRHFICQVDQVRLKNSRLTTYIFLYTTLTQGMHKGKLQRQVQGNPILHYRRFDLNLGQSHISCK